MAEKMGILGRKLGMTRIFAGDGSAVAVTVVQAGPCPVTQVKTAETDGYNALQIAFEEAKEKHVTKAYEAVTLPKPERAHLPQGSRNPPRRSGRCTKWAPCLTADVFAAGDKIKVTGTSLGKGYQGVMRRWNFKGIQGRRTVVKRCIVPVVPSVTTPSPVTCSRAGRWRATGVPNR